MSKHTSNPALVAALLDKQDKAKRRGRAYGLGERNPKTLPGSGADAETEEENRHSTAYWHRLGRQVQTGGMTGNKYV